MNKLSAQKRVQVVAALAEGASINSVVLLTGVTKQTILRLIAECVSAARGRDDAL